MRTMAMAATGQRWVNDIVGLGVAHHWNLGGSRSGHAHVLPGRTRELTARVEAVRMHVL